ncbi:hypothetical protein F5884DRAFT_904044 [Xylogone sp. PMI_703]|nr:hypothetical protein F5884DRAFT_904044 [Xylogone sp. PMI_703]
MSNPQFKYGHTTFTGPSTLSIRRSTISRVTIKAQLRQLRETGRYDCFKLKWHPVYDDKSNWPVPPHLFWDSDLGKWIEGACYFLSERYDSEIDAAVKYLVSTIREAQHDDGYLNLHYTVVEPDKRWTNLRDMHELYNAGHLIEGALAHHQYYKNNDLLEPMEKYVRLIRKTFGKGQDQRHGYPGHPEIELALLRLYKATGNQDAYDLARYFLEERGNPSGQEGMYYFDWEREKLRGESPWMRPNHDPTSFSRWYGQWHLPILQQPTVEGHSVRCMYLLTAAADMVSLSHEGKQQLGKADGWLTSLKRLWNNMVDQKMYLTGGIGAMRQWEGFGINYFLPQSTDEGGCYAETCASVGIMMFAERLLTVDLNSRYADIMELCLYNNVMTAISLNGREFTYVNQLASSDQDKSVRQGWFEVSCCPPNLIRLFGSIGGYIWHFGEADRQAYINVHLYTTARVAFEVGGTEISLEQKSDWPWNGKISFQIAGADSVNTTIRLRIPSWAKGAYTLEPQSGGATVENGYLILKPDYTAANMSFSLNVHGFEPRWISPHSYAHQNTLTLARGPIIYCAEDADNTWETNHFKDIMIKEDSPVTEERCVLEEYQEPYIALHSKCQERSVKQWESKAEGVEPGTAAQGIEIGPERKLTFVPYYFRANRGGKGHMRVGLLKV